MESITTFDQKDFHGDRVWISSIYFDHHRILVVIEY